MAPTHKSAVAGADATTVVFVDVSYYIFYRYYATLNWMKRAQKLPEDVTADSLLEIPEFLAMYNKKFEEHFHKLAKQYRVPMSSIHLVKDCYRDMIWRMEHYPAYKKNRDDRLRSFNGQIFKHTYQTLVPKLQSTYNMLLLEHPHAEADDVIAVWHRRIRHMDPMQTIVIVTNDNDLLQLHDSHTVLVNLAGKHIAQRMEKDHDASAFIKLKILVGDKSDNIPPVFKKCGTKQAIKMIQDPDTLSKKLNIDPEAMQRYLLNTRLISFDHIPADIVMNIEQLKVNWKPR